MANKTNDQIIAETYHKYKKSFLGFVRKNYGLSEDTTNDIYQDTMLAFHQNVLNGNANNLNVPLQTYLFAIGKNKVVDYFRRSNNEIKIERTLDIFSSEGERFNYFYEKEDATVNRRNMIVYNAVSQMENPCKKLLFLFYWDKKSMKEIAEQMNYKSPDVAKQQSQRCKQKIKAYLTQKLKEEKLI